MTKLISPTLFYKDSYLKGLEELMAESPSPGTLEWQIDNFSEYLGRLDILGQYGQYTD